MMTSRIEEYLDSLFPNPSCELIYHNDYQLLIAIVLSAQSTDKRVNLVTSVLFSEYPTLELLAHADIHRLEDIIHPVGSYHKKALFVKQIAELLCEKYDGVVPREREVLMSFPGVGRKTINVFLSEFYQEPAIAVDTHVERISKRLGLARPKDDVYQVEQKLMKKFNRDVWGKRHLQMVLFGRYYCKAIKPSCNTCDLIDICKEKRKNI